MDDFFRAEQHDNVNVDGGYVPGRCDQDALDILKDSLGLLARVAGTARNRPETDTVDSVGARCVLGLSILAIGEAQAALVLLSAGLDRPGRVHLRSLYEYGVRADLVSGDPQTAQRFLAAAAHEAKRLGTDMGLAPDRVQQVIDAYTIPGVAAGREADALGGTMKAIVRAQTDVAYYAMYFAWPSLMSHGSILALHEVSRAIAGSGANFPAAAVTDGTGNANLLQAAVAVHSLTFKLCKVFGIRHLAQELANLIQRADAARSRLFPNIPKRSETLGIEDPPDDAPYDEEGS